MYRPIVRRGGVDDTTGTSTGSSNNSNNERLNYYPNVTTSTSTSTSKRKRYPYSSTTGSTANNNDFTRTRTVAQNIRLLLLFVFLSIIILIVILLLSRTKDLVHVLLLQQQSQSSSSQLQSSTTTTSTTTATNSGTRITTTTTTMYESIHFTTNPETLYTKLVTSTGSTSSSSSTSTGKDRLLSLLQIEIQTQNNNNDNINSILSDHIVSCIDLLTTGTSSSNGKTTNSNTILYLCRKIQSQLYTSSNDDDNTGIVTPETTTTGESKTYTNISSSINDVYNYIIQEQQQQQVQQQPKYIIYYNPFQRQRYLWTYCNSIQIIPADSFLILDTSTTITNDNTDKNMNCFSIIQQHKVIRLFPSTVGRIINNKQQQIEINSIQNIITGYKQQYALHKQYGINPIYQYIEEPITISFSSMITKEQRATFARPNNDYNECNVPCSNYGTAGINIQRYVHSLNDHSYIYTSPVEEQRNHFKLHFSMEGSNIYDNLIIKNNVWKNNIYYSTTSYQSDIPLPYYSWVEYDIIMKNTFYNRRRLRRHRRLLQQQTQTQIDTINTTTFNNNKNTAATTQRQQQQQLQQQLLSETRIGGKMTNKNKRKLANVIPNPSIDMGSGQIPDYNNRIKGAVFMARNCGSNNNRENIVQQLIKNNNNIFHVDSISTCLHNAERPPNVNSDDKVNILSKYMFYLAFENQCTIDYITEKLWQPYVAGTIPIYYGAPNVIDHAPEHSYINVIDFYDPTINSTNPQLHNLTNLSLYLMKVASNITLYNTYHKWRTKPLSTKFHNKYDFTHIHSTCRTCRWAFAKQYGYSWYHTTQSLKDTLNIGIPRYACINTVSSSSSSSTSGTSTSNGLLVQPFIEEWLIVSSNSLDAFSSSSSSSSTSQLAPITLVLPTKDTMLMTKTGDSNMFCELDNIPTNVLIGSITTTTGTSSNNHHQMQRTIIDHDGVIDMYVNHIKYNDNNKNDNNDDNTYILRIRTLLGNTRPVSYNQSLQNTIQFFKEIDIGRYIVQDNDSRITIVSVPPIESSQIRIISHTGIIEIMFTYDKITPLEATTTKIRFISEDVDTLHNDAYLYENYFGILMTKDFYTPIETLVVP